MESIKNISDISKEVLTFLAFFDNAMIEKIPAHTIAKLCEFAADSNLDFYIDITKGFEEQEISEKSKDLISYIYYDYIAEESEKQDILKQWDLNEKNYQTVQKEKYTYDNLFPNKKNHNCVELVEFKKETIFEKIVKLLKRIIR